MRSTLRAWRQTSNSLPEQLLERVRRIPVILSREACPEERERRRDGEESPVTRLVSCVCLSPRASARGLGGRAALKSLLSRPHPSRPLANARGDSRHWFITAALRMTRYHHFRDRFFGGSRPPSPAGSGREGGGDRAARRLLPAASRIDAHALHRRAADDRAGSRRSSRRRARRPIRRRIGSRPWPRARDHRERARRRTFDGDAALAERAGALTAAGPGHDSPR